MTEDDYLECKLYKFDSDRNIVLLLKYPDVYLTRDTFYTLLELNKSILNTEENQTVLACWDELDGTVLSLCGL